MKLYFLRHGEAEDGGAVDDHHRKLTEQGVKRMKTAARVLARLDMRVTHLYSSPRLRARQTADLVAAALHVAVEERDDVNFPKFDLAAIEGMIAPLDDAAEVLFVGHEPTFSDTLQAITGATLEMKKGGLARVDVLQRYPLRGTLVWLIAPRVFDALEA